MDVNVNQLDLGSPRMVSEENEILNIADLELGKDVTFHDEAIIPAAGEEVLVGPYNTLLIEVYGTSATRTLGFKGKSKSGTARSILGFKEGDATFTPATGTTGTGELWKLDVSGLDSISIPLTVVTGGNVSVKGRLVE